MVDVRSPAVDSSGGRSSVVLTKLMLTGGFVSVGLYALGDLVSGLSYEGYSFRDQAISELTAFGSPVRPLMMPMVLVHGFLVLCFGLGVWRATDRRSLRWAGGFLMAAGLIGFPTHTLFAMSSRSMEAGFNDTMHIVLSSVFSLCVFAAIVLTAIAYKGWFRIYAIATLLVLMGFGGAASIAMGGIDENDTPWAGGFERINAYAYFAWLVLLAFRLLSQLPDDHGESSRDGLNGYALAR